MVKTTWILVALLWVSPLCHSFVVVKYPSTTVFPLCKGGVSKSVACHAMLLFLPDSPSPLLSTIMTTASASTVDGDVIMSSSQMVSVVETFDGSQIIDPVVVSGVFWTSLKAKFISLIVGQLLATIIFGILTTLAATQFTKLADFIADTLQQQQQSSTTTASVDSDRRGANTNTRTFRKANEFNQTPITMDVAKLALCILIDIIGTSSELIPILGEATDIIWAPIAGLVLRNLFYGSNVLLVMEFTEEILPFTDVLPLATLCWVLDTFFGDSNAARALGIGSYGRQQQVRVALDNDDDNDIIDVIVDEPRRDDKQLLPEDKRR